MQELHAAMTTIELNNSYYLIITYFLRKFLSPFKLIPLKEPYTFFFQSFVTRIWIFPIFIQNSKLLSFKKFSSSSSLQYFPKFRIFSLLEISSSNLLCKKLKNISSMFFSSRDISRPRNGPREFRNRSFETILLILEKRYSKILHHRSATRFINMISRPETKLHRRP